MNKRKLSFVIPCYGSENTINSVIKRIIDVVKPDDNYEIVCVNDCSSDNVFDVLKHLAHENHNIKVIDLAKNVGQHNALMAGFNVVSGDIIICLDDDGQTDPANCYQLINALTEDVDIVYAKYPKKKESLFRLFGSWTAKKMSQWLISIPKEIDQNSYFACKRFLIDEIIRYNFQFSYIGGLVGRSTKRIANIDIPHYERENGKSGYSLKKLVSLWLNGFTAFSVKPLRIATIVGGITASAGFLFAIYVIVKKILNPSMPMGYSSTMCVLLFIGGMLMLMLGLIGEYIGRIYICINKAPQYVVRNTININEK